jgi:hypothetical protein
MEILYGELNFEFMTYSFISNLSDDRSTASSKTIPPLNAIYSFLLQISVSSSVPKVIQQLITSSSSSSCHFYLPLYFSSITSFRRQFLRKIWPIQLAFRFLISCRIFLCSLTLSNTSSFLIWSVQLIFSILLQHHFYDLLPTNNSITLIMVLKISHWLRFGNNTYVCVSLCLWRLSRMPEAARPNFPFLTNKHKKWGCTCLNMSAKPQEKR